jgi:hypothetical protein
MDKPFTSWLILPAALHSALDLLSTHSHNRPAVSHITNRTNLSIGLRLGNRYDWWATTLAQLFMFRAPSHVENFPQLN